MLKLCPKKKCDIGLLDFKKSLGRDRLIHGQHRQDVILDFDILVLDVNMDF